MKFSCTNLRQLKVNRSKGLWSTMW